MKRLLPCFLSVVTLAGVACHRPAIDRTPREITAATARLSPAISAEDLRADVTFLASDECEGRLTGSPGVLRAAQYIAAAFRDAGLQPAGEHNSYYQGFEFTSGVRQVSGRNRMAIVTSSDAGVSAPCKLDTDFRPLTYSANGIAEGEVVFAGYGLVEPQSATGKEYDSYTGLDVSGKIVLALRDLPEDVSPERRQELARYAGSRYKAKLAADRGAKGFLLVAGPNSPDAGKLIRFRQGDRTASVPIVAASISGELADRLLAPAGKDLKTLQTLLDGGQVNPHANISSGTCVQLEMKLERVRKSCRNVIGLLPPTEGSDEYVMVGGHYDHIGHGVGLGSLAKEGEKGQIHNGADDNASGTSVVLELAGAIAEARRTAEPSEPQRGVAFACWSGEELGLVGSSQFVNHPTIPLDKIVAYFNFDMVGRLRDDKLIVQSIGSSPVWRGLVERRNVPAGFDLALNDDPYLPSDSTAFYTKGMPTLALFTDLHEDYNRPTDDPETLNYDGMARITSFAKRLVEDAANPEFEIAYAKIKRSAPAGSGMGMRAYTGIVPDFAAGGMEGMQLADVRAGGPADQAGLKGGDRIVEFAGQKINSLQDYADALTGAKIGQPVTVVVERDGRRITLTMTPASRPQ
ncbi:MAG: M28 family peptidase [Phycisphaerae bacterium]